MKQLCLVIFALALAGCATSPEVTAWNIAREVNTPAGYQNFVQQYPSSSHVKDARKLIEKSKIDRIMKADSVSECVRTMKSNPDPKTAAMVADLAVKAAQKETSVADLYDFITYFKGHVEVGSVRNKLEELEFKGAREEASPVAMEYFLFRYPESRFADEGRKLFAEKSYAQVKAWGNQFGFKAFLWNFPESPRAAEVRGWIISSLPPAGSSDFPETLVQAVENSPWLKKYGCALTLSAGIRKKTGDVDSLRHALYEIETGGNSGSLPDACSTVILEAKPGLGEALDEGLLMMAKAEDRRTELATHWKVYGERDEMAKAAFSASSIVADELESAELSEEVLGSGPLGGLDVGREKASVSARKALERFNMAEKTIARDRADIKRLLLEMDGLYRPLQFYVASCLVAKSGGEL